MCARSKWKGGDGWGLKVLCALLALCAVLRLGYEYRRLLLLPAIPVDLGIFHAWVHAWFASSHIIQEDLCPLVFPPASYILLWPIFGWLALTPCRWFFALIVSLSLVWLIRIVVTHTPAGARNRSCIILLLLAIYATGITIGNGQLVLFILPMLLCAFQLLFRVRRSWRRDACASGLLLLSMVKPPIAAPFFLIVLLVNRAYRVIAMVVLAYFLLTVWALSMQDMGLDYIRIMGENAAQLSTRGGYGNIHMGLYRLGLQEWRFPASLSMVAVLALWLYFTGNRNPWLLLGVTAIVARIWTYHRLYDDLLLIVPLIALLQVCHDESRSAAVRKAGRVFAILLGVALLGPGTLLRSATPLGMLYGSGQVLLWLAILVFLAALARSGAGDEIGPCAHQRRMS
jgi:hypothetical protein